MRLNMQQFGNTSCKTHKMLFLSSRVMVGGAPQGSDSAPLEFCYKTGKTAEDDWQRGLWKAELGMNLSVLVHPYVKRSQCFPINPPPPPLPKKKKKQCSSVKEEGLKLLVQWLQCKCNISHISKRNQLKTKTKTCWLSGMPIWFFF